MITGINFVRIEIYIIVSFVMLIFGSNRVIAQENAHDYLPFVEDGKVWYCGHEHYFDSPSITLEDPMGHGIDCIFTLSGDTLIDNVQYKKVYCQYEEYYGDNKQHYYCAVREESCRVYCVEKEATNEKMLYDFSDPNDTHIFSYADRKIARIGGYKRLGFLDGQFEYTLCKYTENGVDYSEGYGVWIGGVGSVYGNPFAFELQGDESKLGSNIRLVSCKTDNVFIFHLGWMAEPIIPTSINKITYQYPPSCQFLFDLQGRPVVGTPKRGIYVKEGRKKIIGDGPF